MEKAFLNLIYINLLSQLMFSLVKVLRVMSEMNNRGAEPNPLQAKLIDDSAETGAHRAEMNRRRAKLNGYRAEMDGNPVTIHFCMVTTHFLTVTIHFCTVLIHFCMVLICL